MAPLAWLKGAKREWAETNANELGDLQANGLAHQANLALVPFVEHKRERPARPSGHSGGTGLPAFNDNALAKLVKLLIRGIGHDPDVILAWQLVPWVKQAIRQLAVVREEDDPATVEVEAA